MTLKIVMAGACPYPVPQGSQVFLGETARCLAGLDHDVRLLVYGYGNHFVRCRPLEHPADSLDLMIHVAAAPR